MKNALLLSLILALGSGCSVFGNKDDDKPVAEVDTNEPAAILYNAGREARNSKNYEKMIRIYETLESRYPFGPYAQQARLEIAYGLYKRGRHELAIETLDQFFKLYPRHENLDYAYYLQGLANFHQLENVVDKFLDRNIASMDSLPIQDSFSQFKTLVENYPESKYAPDARQRMIYLRNLLADHEIEVARFYESRGAYAAVAKRAAYVVEHYHNANATPQALLMLINAYDELGLQASKEETQKVLEMNFPELAK